MCLSDTAEYWQDVKSHFQNKRQPFVHIKGFDCGHYHVVDTNKLHHVDCYACRKHIDSNDELIKLMKQQEKQDEQNRINKIKSKWVNKYPNNPICPTCGFVMLERTNKQSGQKFFGCCQYPKCKTTAVK